MRKTQLDASTPRQMRGSEPRSSDEKPRVNYVLPLFVTLLASIVVLIFMLTLTIGMFSVSTDFFNDSQGGGNSILMGGFCGIVSLLCVAADIYFVLALVKVLRDLFTPLQIRRGVLLGRRSGRGGASWIELDFEPASEVTTDKPAAPERSTLASAAPLATTSGAAARTVAPASNLSFGAQLQAAGGEAGSGGKAAVQETDNTADMFTDKRRRGKSLRVDKHIYDALAVGDEIVVAYSLHIEHVYYVQRLAAGGNNLLLRNLSLI